MNHLAHFKVAHPDPGLIVGGFLGDFVKGRLDGTWPEAIERGIALHRAVDAFADRHPVTRESVSRFDPRFRRYGPIMVDVMYDHLLARHWHRFHEVDIDAFNDHVFDVLEERESSLPVEARQVAQRMRANRSLTGYTSEEYVQRSLTYLGTRLRRDNPLGEAHLQFRRLKSELELDFSRFFPELLAFCQAWRASNCLTEERNIP